MTRCQSDTSDLKEETVYKVSPFLCRRANRRYGVSLKMTPDTFKFLYEQLSREYNSITYTQLQSSSSKKKKRSLPEDQEKLD